MRRVRRADNLTTLMCRLSWNLGASTSWNPQGLSRPVMEYLYLFNLHINDSEFDRFPRRRLVVGVLNVSCLLPEDVCYVLQVVTPCSLICRHRRFGGNAASICRVAWVGLYLLDLEYGVILVPTNYAARLLDQYPNTYRNENLRFYIVVFCLLLEVELGVGSQF